MVGTKRPFRQLAQRLASKPSMFPLFDRLSSCPSQTNRRKERARRKSRRRRGFSAKPRQGGRRFHHASSSRRERWPPPEHNRRRQRRAQEQVGFHATHGTRRIHKSTGGEGTGIGEGDADGQSFSFHVAYVLRTALRPRHPRRSKSAQGIQKRRTTVPTASFSA